MCLHLPRTNQWLLLQTTATGPTCRVAATRRAFEPRRRPSSCHRTGAGAGSRVQLSCQRTRSLGGHWVARGRRADVRDPKSIAAVILGPGALREIFRAPHSASHEILASHRCLASNVFACAARHGATRALGSFKVAFQSARVGSSTWLPQVSARGRAVPQVTPEVPRQRPVHGTESVRHRVGASQTQCIDAPRHRCVVDSARQGVGAPRRLPGRRGELERPGA